MNKIKQIFCTTLAVAMALCAGCGSNSKAPEMPQQDARPAGRYVETEITPTLETTRPPHTIGLYPGVNGALFYLATVSGASEEAREEVIYRRSADNGATWDDMPVEWYDALWEQYGSPGHPLLKNAAFGNDGTLYCLLTRENNWYRAVKIKDGAIEEIPIEDWEQQSFYDALQGFYVQAFEVLSNNDIVISFDIFDQYSFVYDGSTGKLKKNIETQDATVFLGKDGYAKMCFDETIHGNALQSFQYDGSETFKCPIDSIDGEAFYLSGGPDALYLICETGIYRFPKGAAEGSQVMDAGMYTFGSPSWYIKRFQYDDVSSAFYAILKNHENGKEKLFCYTFDPSAPSGFTGELTIFALRDSDTLRQAVSVYQRSHPDWDINLELGLAEDTAVTSADVIRVLNTELLAKKGPDVLILDGLPVETYIEKGVLADLSGLVASDSLFSNIANVYASENGVYAIPARFEIPVLCGEKPLVDAMSSLPRIVEQAQNLPPLPAELPLQREQKLPQEKRPLAFIYSPWDTARLFYSTYRPQMIQDGQSLNTELLSELLSGSKALYDRLRMNRRFDRESEALTMDILSYDPRDVYGERTILGITGLRDFEDCYRYSRAAPQKSGEKIKSAELYFAPLCGPAKSVFIPHCVAALNISSQKSDAGREFIQTLLSEEVQFPAYSEGFPVNKVSFQSRYDESVTRWSVKYLLDMEQLAASLTTPVTIDETILGAILDEIKPYYNDEETLDEAIAHINAKLRTYLAEKS